MIVRSGTFGLLAVAVTMWTATTARAGEKLGLAAAGAAFPERAFVLTLPSPRVLDPMGVEVLENGKSVTDLRVVPVQRAEAGTVGVVLAIDASLSMRGRAETAAIAAARTFADGRPPTTALGLVAFNAHPRVLLAPSTDGAAIRAALRRPVSLALGTTMRDAIARSIALLSRSHIRIGSVVVLSDGADIGSRTGANELLRLARDAGVRISAVGLRSRQFAPEPLRELARATGGRYVEAATASALPGIYAALGKQLASEYLLRYRSSAAPGDDVRLALRVKGVPGVGTLAYRAPSASAVSQGPHGQRFWRSDLTIAAFAAAMAAVAAILIRRLSRRSVASRIAAFVDGDRRRHRRGETARERLTVMVERPLSYLPGWQTFARDAEIAHLGAPPVLLGSSTAAVALLLGPGSALLAHEAFLLVLGLLPPVLLRASVSRRLASTRRLFEEQLPGNLEVLASAMRTGYGLAGALGVVVRDAVEPSRAEFERALAEERLGVPLEDALWTVAERMRSGDLEQVALVAGLHRQTGGNTAEVLDRANEAIRGRAELRRLVRSLTAEGRMTRWILTGMPVGLVSLIGLLNRSYLRPFVDTTLGRLLAGLAVLMLVAGSLIIKRIVEIEV